MDFELKCWEECPMFEYEPITRDVCFFFLLKLVPVKNVSLILALNDSVSTPMSMIRLCNMTFTHEFFFFFF